MLYERLHHTQFDLFRRCYERNLLVREMNLWPKQAPLTAAEKVKVYRARCDLANDKAALKRIRNIKVTLDDVNAALDYLTSLQPKQAHALIDKWEYKARQK